MYKFSLNNLQTVDMAEYNNGFAQKNLFSTTEWLMFLSEFRKVKPIIIRITDDNDSFQGYFTAAKTPLCGWILGSPFYGWMGLHMGFDLVCSEKVNYSVLLNETIDYIKANLRVGFVFLTDFKLSKDDIAACNNPNLYCETETVSYFLDLETSEDAIFKNFKSGYRTCVRKFEKLGGTVVEDYSDEFIAEHNKQLKDVFSRKKLSAPDYSKRMKILRDKYPDMILFIKALDENGNNIASSYYLGGGTMAYFTSNASYTDALNYNANQALMWYAIKYWKAKRIKTLDFAGPGEYKANFGSEFKSTPIVVWAKHKWQYEFIIKLRDIYYMKYRVKPMLKKALHCLKKSDN